ncbi:MAG TPA: flagellar basal body L-ring protein FlgH [Caulobacterales bacterium]|nr:flagellar basal body L-ring protein FlgH [Caulobacterales bacterium]
MEKHIRRVAMLALAAASTACASTENVDTISHDALAAPGAAVNAAHRALQPPQLSPVANPAPLTGSAQQSIPQPEPAAYDPGRPNSLWRAGRRSFFNDQRAQRVGDILTVEIEIDDKAEVTNSSDRSRSSSTSAGVTNFFGAEQALGHLLGADPSTLVNAESSSDHSGDGAINRKEKIELNLAAVVVDTLPNGNLVIAGRQEVRVNGELRELTVSGVIRPEDISANNTIRHDQIAEARVSYGGRGSISAVQRPNWGQRIADAITPW